MHLFTQRGGGQGKAEKNGGFKKKRAGRRGEGRGGPQESRPHPLLGHQQLLLGILLLDVVVLHLHLVRQLQPLLKGLRSVPGAV